MFTCDVCGREVFSCNIVNGMKFCAKCYQETFGNQKKYVDMLHKETGELLVNLLAEKDKQIAELQKQLEEKDEEIAYLTKQVKKFNNEAQKYFEDAYCNDFNNQDKISFAVEKLEKVKEILIQNADEIGEEYKEDYFMISLCNVKNIIDNQIKQLTHQHEDKGE